MQFNIQQNDRRLLLNVMRTQPELFTDLPPIPADVALMPGYVFKP